MPQNVNQQANAQKPLFYRRAIDNLFLDHPAEMGETYSQHLWFAIKTGGYLLVTFAALVFHGLVPKFHQTTASDRIIQLTNILQERRNTLNASAQK